MTVTRPDGTVEVERGLRMNMVNRKVKFMGIVCLIGLLMAVPTVILAQEDGVICNPAAARLAEIMELETGCQGLLDMQAEGHGLGEIMKAWYLADDLEGMGDWRELLAQKQAEGVGWGHFKMAYRLAGQDGETARQLLGLKQMGHGWGQIKKAQAIEATGKMSFDEALALIESGAGWDEIRTQLGYDEGPPPWAGPKVKGDNGPPPWANNDKNDKTSDE